MRKIRKSWWVIWVCFAVWGLFEVSAYSQSLNLSTRGYVGTGDNVMIAGVCIDDYYVAVVRALGPSLAARGVSGVLRDPEIDVYDRYGVRVASNDDWEDDEDTANILRQIGMAPSSSLESAIVDIPDPGCYTIVVRGVGGSTGVALVEVFLY